MKHEMKICWDESRVGCDIYQVEIEADIKEEMTDEDVQIVKVEINTFCGRLLDVTKSLESDENKDLLEGITQKARKQFFDDLDIASALIDEEIKRADEEVDGMIKEGKI